MTARKAKDNAKILRRMSELKMDKRFKGHQSYQEQADDFLEFEAWLQEEESL